MERKIPDPQYVISSMAIQNSLQGEIVLTKPPASGLLDGASEGFARSKDVEFDYPCKNYAYL